MRGIVEPCSQLGRSGTGQPIAISLGASRAPSGDTTDGVGSDISGRRDGPKPRAGKDPIFVVDPTGFEKRKKVTRARVDQTGGDDCLTPREILTDMIRNNSNYIVSAWNFIFDHEVSPVRNIPDIAVRHYVLQALGLMWAVSFSLAIGSYTFLAASLIGHTVLIGAAAITVATLTAAAKKPEVFVRHSSRRLDGEHE